MNNITTLNGQEFKELVSKNKAVVAFFYLGWNDSSLSTKVIFDNISNSLDSNVILTSIDVGIYPDFKEELEIDALPTTIFFRGIHEVGREKGFFNQEKFMKKMEENYGKQE